MLFNSPVFLFAFLPLTLCGFFLLGRVTAAGARLWLSAASLFFYAWYNPIYLLLLGASLIFNFYVGAALQNYGHLSFRLLPSKKGLLYLGLAFNIGLLGYFKYAFFIVENVNAVAGTDIFTAKVALPLAISFFTFQKIAYLVDSYLGKVREASFLNFVLFAAFFPQLIAGPIVHYSEIFPQLRKETTYRFQWPNFTEGATIFLLGLAKKVVLADEFGRYADIVFDGVAQGGSPTLIPAWLGALAYTLQLYFDFSGYSDMAIGLARMMNIALPLNFFSPYRASNIIEFWRRWHMTLSRFLRDYIYIPLGGNRHGVSRRYLNLLLTMLIGGIWHGAGWTFILWGAVHGAALAANHLWQAWRPSRPSTGWRRLLAHAATLLVVIFGWVVFRSASVPAAGKVLAGMIGYNGAALPNQIIAILPPLRHMFTGMTKVPFLADATIMGTFEAGTMLFIGYAIALGMPNLYQMSRRGRLCVVCLSFAFVIQKVLFASDVSPFLYFQF